MPETTELSRLWAIAKPSAVTESVIGKTSIRKSLGAGRGKTGRHTKKCISKQTLKYNTTLNTDLAKLIGNFHFETDKARIAN